MMKQDSLLLIQNRAVNADGHYLPGNEFAAVFQGCFGHMLDTAAAGDLHSDDGNALDIVVSKDPGQLFGIINAVKFRTANESNVVADEILMKIAIGISGAICCNEQVCTLKVRSLDRDKLDLHRPLTKLRGQGKAKVCGSFVCRVCSVVNLPCTASGAAACRKCRRVSL